jgi:hypothetical protein
VKIQPQQFVQTFLQVARHSAVEAHTVEQLDRLEASASPPSSKGMLATLQGWLGSSRASLSPAQIEESSKQTLQQACQLVGPSLAGVVAQKVGLELFTPAHEAAAGQEQQQRLQGGRGFEALWQGVSRYATRSVECQTVERGNFGPAMFMGQTIFLNAQELQGMPAEVQLFLVAHELGHVEHRDSAAKMGLHTLTVLHPSLAFDPNVASHEMEFAADRRAAEIAAREGCRPHEILRTLMSWPGGQTHPEGVSRAAAVRDTMAQHGVTIAESEYQQLLQETSSLRDAARARAQEETDMLNAFRDLV